MARKTRKRRTPAQKAATRKLVAMNKRRGKPAKRRSPARAATPAKRRRRNPIAAPAKRRRAYSASAPAVRRRRRNPIKARGIMNTMITPAITAAGGALALDIAWAYAPIPENLKVGNLKHVAKAAGAVGMAMLAGQVVKQKTAEAMGVGALTVVFHDALKEIINTNMPALKMDGMGYYNAGQPAGTLDYSTGNNDMAYYAAPGNNNNAMGYYAGGGNTGTPESGYNNAMGYYAQ